MNILTASPFKIDFYLYFAALLLGAWTLFQPETPASNLTFWLAILVCAVVTGTALGAIRCARYLSCEVTEIVTVSANARRSLEEELFQCRSAYNLMSAAYQQEKRLRERAEESRPLSGA